MLLLLFMTYPLYCSPETIHHWNYVDSLVITDLDELRRFESSDCLYGVNDKEFINDFYKGLKKAKDFYLQTNRISGRAAHAAIADRLVANRNLIQQLPFSPDERVDFRQASEVLNEFAGNWYGSWGEMQVHHLWLPVVNVESKVDNQFKLLGFQSCFIGDGYGWNFVAEVSGVVVILGFVYHVDNGAQVVSENPHLAAVGSKGQLTWISDTNIYYELVCEASSGEKSRSYVITGAHYEKKRGRLNLTSGFQAIYYSDQEQEPLYKDFDFDLLSKTKDSVIKVILSAWKKVVEYLVLLPKLKIYYE